MKKTTFFLVFAMLPAALDAQAPALSQLGGMEAVKAAGIAQAAIPEAPPASRDNNTLMPPAPSAGQVADDPRQARAAAGISGRWLGQGEWTYQGSGTHCYMRMEFEEGADYLFRKGGYFDCSVVGLEIEPARFAKKGTQLLNPDGLVVGSYEKNVIELNEVYSDEVAITTTIKVDGLHFDYSEIWRGKDGSELYNIRGRLFTGGSSK